VLVGCRGGGSGSAGTSADPPLSADPVTLEGGTLYTTSGLRVAVLKGTWRGMGRQYGYLLKQRMTDFYNLAAGDTGRNYAQMVASTESYYQGLPSHLQDLVLGMAETSGISLERQKIVASLPDQLFFPGACSTLTAWGDYTGGRPLVIGRNMDFGRNFPLCMHYAIVAVFNPEGASASVANVDFVGGLHFTTVTNSRSGSLRCALSWPTRVSRFVGDRM
jgi:hypothetical protein